MIAVAILTMSASLAVTNTSSVTTDLTKIICDFSEVPPSVLKNWKAKAEKSGSTTPSVSKLSDIELNGKIFPIEISFSNIIEIENGDPLYAGYDVDLSTLKIVDSKKLLQSKTPFFAGFTSLKRSFYLRVPVDKGLDLNMNVFVSSDRSLKKNAAIAIGRMATERRVGAIKKMYLGSCTFSENLLDAANKVAQNK